MLSYMFIILLVGVCESRKPNFVLFLTDDQDVVLGGMSPMKNVRQLIEMEGITFRNSFVTSPICCPSRASILSGQYVHNHLTHNNSIAGGCYGDSWRKREDKTFNTMLKCAGYSTFYAGKYMNEYGTKAAGGPEHVPPGWSEWHGLVGNSVYYDYTLSNNGVPTHTADLYLTDVIRDLSLAYIDNQTKSQPFFMIVAPPAPHQPFTPAPRHEDKFRNVTAIRFPNFNVSVTDKHWLMRMPPSPLPSELEPELDRVFRSRWKALLSVDEMVGDIVEKLNKSSMLEDTYLIYTSDNGYHIGQFSQVYDKRQPYETDIRVPLTIRGPKIGKNIKTDQPILNIDLAPTILRLAELEPPSYMDGRPIKILDTGCAKLEDRKMLVEYYGEGRDGTVDANCPWNYDQDNLAQCYPAYACKCQDSRNNTYACLRHIANNIDMKYCMFADKQGFEEIYDLNEDPYEMTNIVNHVFPSIKSWYRFILAKMITCRGQKNCDDPLDEKQNNVVELGMNNPSDEKHNSS